MELMSESNLTVDVDVKSKKNKNNVQAHGRHVFMHHAHQNDMF